MKIIDTHAHVYADEFAVDLEQVVFRARQAGVQKVLLPNIDIESVPALKKTVAAYPDFFAPMMGLHPTSVRDDWQTQLQQLRHELENGEYCAVGEIGIDLYWDTTYKQQQIAAFEEQLRWAAHKNLPVAIHTRNAFAEVLQSLKNVDGYCMSGVFHSFGGNVRELQAALVFENFYVGISGVVTFKNSGLGETLKQCPLSRIVLETDSPYLAPVPYRGKRNEPSYLQQIIAKLADIYNVDEDEIVRITTQNVRRLFASAFR